MKELYKNPILYYILVPVMVALWPLLLWGRYLPKVEDNLEAEMIQYKEARGIMDEILTLDEGRLEFGDSNTVAVKFDYARAVEKVAALCGIISQDYKLSSRGIRKTKSKGQKTQDADLNLKKIDIVRFSKFLSMIQLRWADLECTRLRLTKKKGLADTWDIDIVFKYYY